MKMVKNLTAANIRRYANFVRREDLDFSDDGNNFRGFSYKGMPITTLRSNKDNTTYLSIRVDYLSDLQFTYKQWMETEEWKLCDEFNGVSEFDMDLLVEHLETIIAKVEEMNAAAEAEDVDMTAVVDALFDEIVMAESIVSNFKSNFKWYEASSCKLNQLLGYMKNAEAMIANAKAVKVHELTKVQKKQMSQKLDEFGFVIFAKNQFYLTELDKAVRGENK